MNLFIDVHAEIFKTHVQSVFEKLHIKINEMHTQVSLIYSYTAFILS